MTRGRDREPVPDFILERYLLAELPPAEMARLRERVARDESLRRRLEDLQRSNDTLRREWPVEGMADQVRDRLQLSREAAGRAVRVRRTPEWRARWTLSTAAVAVALILVAVLPKLTGPDRDGPAVPSSSRPNGAVRIKGLEPGLTLFRKTADGSEVLADSALVRAGDLVRVGYHAAGHAWGAILSVDSRGAVTLHLSQQGARAVPLRAGDNVLLESAYELDDAPLWERFYFVTGDGPFDLETVTSATQQAAARGAPPDLLPLPTGLQQSVFTLRKGPKP